MQLYVGHTFSIDIISPTRRSSLVISTARLVAVAPPSFLPSDSVNINNKQQTTTGLYHVM